MKKFLSVILAVAMIASLSAVAFAADYNNITGALNGSTDGDFTAKVEDGKTYYPVVNAIGPFGYDADEKKIFDDVVEYGETAYFALIQGVKTGVANNAVIDGDDFDSFSLVSESETVSSLKVKTKWEEGSKFVKSVSIVKKKVTNAVSGADYVNSDNEVYQSAATLKLDTLGYAKDKYYYFIAIQVEDSTSTADADIIGTLTLNKSKAPKVKDLEFDVEVNIGWKHSYLSSTPDLNWELDGDPDSDIEAETYYSIKFKSDIDDEIEITFADDSIFTVDCSGQSKILLYYDTNYNSKIAAKYPLAELNFWNGNGAKFNRVGEMFLACDEDYSTFLYQVNADGTLSEVPGAEYDDADEGFYFNTRVLGTYVISDMELDVSKPATSAPAVTTPVVTTPSAPVSNPSTGAAA